MRFYVMTAKQERGKRQQMQLLVQSGCLCAMIIFSCGKNNQVALPFCQSAAKRKSRKRLLYCHQMFEKRPWEMHLHKANDSVDHCDKHLELISWQCQIFTWLLSQTQSDVGNERLYHSLPSYRNLQVSNSSTHLNGVYSGQSFVLPNLLDGLRNEITYNIIFAEVYCQTNRLISRLTLCAWLRDKTPGYSHIHVCILLTIPWVSWALIPNFCIQLE